MCRSDLTRAHLLSPRAPTRPRIGSGNTDLRCKFFLHVCVCMYLCKSLCHRNLLFAAAKICETNAAQAKEKICGRECYAMPCYLCCTLIWRLQQQQQQDGCPVRKGGTRIPTSHVTADRAIYDINACVLGSSRGDELSSLDPPSLSRRTYTSEAQQRLHSTLPGVAHRARRRNKPHIADSA